MKNPRAVELINLIGILIALTTLGVDPWAITAPGAEGLKIALAVFFALEAVCVYLSMRYDRREWLRIQFLLSLLVLGALIAALFVYGVRGEGVMVMIVIALLTTETSLMMSFLAKSESSAVARSAALGRLSIDWQMVAQQAASSNITLSVLSVYTKNTLSSETATLLEKELRSRDLFMRLEDGLLILLWDALPAIASQVGSKLRMFILEQAQIDSWMGIASFPLHGDRIKMVLGHAEEALQLARSGEGSPIVVYGFTSRADTIQSLEKDWESLLEIAKQNQQAVSVLSVTTSQPLKAEMSELVQRELRARDVIAPMPNGFFVFLLKADQRVVAQVAARVEETLMQWRGMQCWVGTGSYPNDGETIGELLRHAERNTQRLAYGDVNAAL